MKEADTSVINMDKVINWLFEGGMEIREDRFI